MKKTIILLTTMTSFIACSPTKKNAYPTTLIVDAKSSYVMLGDTFFAQVIPVGSTLGSNQMSFENTGVKITSSHWDKGILNVAIKTDQLGLSNFSGNLKIKTDNGDTVISFSYEFATAKPIVCIKTKFLIRNIENPIELAMTGVPPFFKLTAPDAEINGDFGKYTITPHKNGPLKLTVESADGKVNYGSFDFEVLDKK